MEEEELDEDGLLKLGDGQLGTSVTARNQCHICMSQFPLEKTYVEHMYNVHGVQRPFRCQVIAFISTCHYNFLSLELHSTVETPNGDFCQTFTKVR